MATTTKNVRWNQLFTNNFTAMLAMAALFLMIGTPGVFAQSGRANITGTVTDSQGAVVAGATVTATNTATGVAIPTTTNGAGAYYILQLVPGVYTLKVEKEGFGAAEQANTRWIAEQNLGINFALQPGKVSEKVTVEAGAELVHTETAELEPDHQREGDYSSCRSTVAILHLCAAHSRHGQLRYCILGKVPTNRSGTQSYTTFPTETGPPPMAGAGQHLLSAGRRLQRRQL